MITTCCCKDMKIRCRCLYMIFIHITFVQYISIQMLKVWSAQRLSLSVITLRMTPCCHLNSFLGWTRLSWSFSPLLHKTNEEFMSKSATKCTKKSACIPCRFHQFFRLVPQCILYPVWELSHSDPELGCLQAKKNTEFLLGLKMHFQKWLFRMTLWILQWKSVKSVAIHVNRVLKRYSYIADFLVEIWALAADFPICSMPIMLRNSLFAMQRISMRRTKSCQAMSLFSNIFYWHFLQYSE